MTNDCRAVPPPVVFAQFAIHLDEHDGIQTVERCARSRGPMGGKGVADDPRAAGRGIGEPNSGLLNWLSCAPVLFDVAQQRARSDTADPWALVGSIGSNSCVVQEANLHRVDLGHPISRGNAGIFG